MRELERTGAFDRSWLMIASPTGTGYVNYAAVSILEMPRARRLRDGRDAVRGAPVAAVARPGRRGPHAQRSCCVDALRDRLAQCPPDARPKVVLFGESLGAWTSQDAFVDRARRVSSTPGIDHAIWIGTPHFSKWKEQVLFDDRPDVDREPHRRVQRHRRVGGARSDGARPASGS